MSTLALDKLLEATAASWEPYAPAAASRELDKGHIDRLPFTGAENYESVLPNSAVGRGSR